MNHQEWYQLAADQAISTLETNVTNGLSQTEARERLERYGPNVLEERKGRGPAAIFLAQFNDFLIWVLLAATVVSIFVLRELLDGIAILVIVILNAILGFVQEYRAENALAALRELAAPKATVIRDGVPVELETRDIVPGDIVIIATGDHVPADGRLIEAVGLRVDEATLTGESGGTTKRIEPLPGGPLALGDQRNMIFAGSVAVTGRGKAVIVATGKESEMGRVAEMIQVEEAKTPLQMELHDVGTKIGLLALGVCVVVFLAGVGRGNPPVEMFLVAVSLAVAAIPESLPAVVTISLALGVQLMARKNAIVRRLHAVETLGSTTIICTDKTGTLTKNQMMVVRLFAAGALIDLDVPPPLTEAIPEDVLVWTGRVALLCNDAFHGPDGTLVGDPTETALLVAAEKLGAYPDEGERVYELAFDSERKRMTTINRLEGKLWALVKGAPEAVLPLCSREITAEGIDEFTDGDSERMHKIAADLAGQGYRTLALAYRPADESDVNAPEERVERELILVGILALVDPPRPEVDEAIAACRDAKIRVAMVTGDHLLTAKTIGRQIGLGGRAISGVELDAMSDEELAEAAEGIAVYARVNPEHKLRLVKALKAHREIVAMTGDGVNDAPAVKQADIGIAMGKVGTDVTRQAADMVLADDNFATIVAAIREGRMIFDNIRKSILFLLSCNVSEVLIMLIAMALVAKPALLPLQILWINLITDGLPALALGNDPPSSQIMKRPPRSATERILAPQRLVQASWQGALITAGGIGGFAGGLALGHSLTEARTMVFSAMVLTQLLHSLNFRSDWRTVFSRNTLLNRRLIAAVILSAILQLLVVYTPPLRLIFDTMPLTATELGVVVLASLLPVVIIDRIKVARAVVPGEERVD